jgi:hypothetical protein
MSQDVKFDFAKDNYFAELKEIEAIRERVSILRDIDDYAGKYVSHAWIRKHVLRQTEQDIEENDEQMEEELDDPRFAAPIAPPAEEDGGQGGNQQR